MADMYAPYKWEFNQEVQEVFDSHVRKQVPQYELFHKFISDISMFFISDNTNILDIGTQTGELLQKLYYNESCKYIGIDTSQSMIDIAQKKFGNKYTFIKQDIMNYQIDNCSVITMMLVLQFIRPENKQSVIDRVYKCLNKGGVFLFVDKIKTQCVDIHDIYNDKYYDFKRNSGLQDKEILDKNISLRSIQKCISLEENIDILKKSGFRKLDIFMKYGNFVGIVAIK